MPDCSTCESFEANEKGKIVPCPGSGRSVFQEEAEAGEKQHTLLYLVYLMALDCADAAGRKGRTTPFGVKGQLLKKPRKIADKQLNEETQRLVGMVLAQRVRTLSTLALQRWQPQEALLQSIADAIFTDPNTLFDPQEVPFGGFTGRGGGSEATLRARGYVRKLHERMAYLNALLQNPGELLNQTSSEVNAQVGALVNQANGAQAAREQKVKEFPWRQQNEITLLTAQRNQMANLGNLYSQQRREIEARVAQLKTLWQGSTDPVYQKNCEEEAKALVAEGERLMAQCQELSTKIEAYSDEIQEWTQMTAEEYAKDLSDEIARLMQTAQQIDASRGAIAERRADQIRQELAEFDRLAQFWRAKAEESARADYALFREQRDSLIRESLQNDFALQKQNYSQGDQNWVQLLNTAVNADMRAAHIFLSLHPKFKYKWTAPIMCRMVKLLTDATPNGFLDLWQQLDDTGLSSPGIHARLGIFVMNSLSPGGYDESHRQMVQWEVDKIAQTMREFGVGDRITCHSCGAAEFRDPNKSGWIRDHNPPTALVELLDNEGIDLGLPFYNKSLTNLRRQILLPQCLGCSERQSAIAAKAKTILSGQALLRGQPPAAVRGYLVQQLTIEEFADLCRVVLNPLVGWSNQGQSNNPSQVVFNANGYAQVTFGPNPVLSSDLVTSGVAGSFAGVNDGLVGQLGDQYGCHTCIDVANQTDAYRGISWIADHQPPTALVARGLAELPQLVLPHCHACSKKQSALTRKLATVFDNCFGKGWGAEWSEDIAVTRFDDVD